MSKSDLVARFAELERQIDVHGRTWWASSEEPQRTFLRENPRVRARLLAKLMQNNPITTVDVYAKDGEVAWHAVRQGVHESLLAELMSGAAARQHADHNEVAAPVYFLIGLPGSGKSSTLRPLALRHAQGLGDPVVSDADEIRIRLPEYSDGLGSSILQPETVLLTYGSPSTLGLQQRAMQSARPVIVDVIGDPLHLTAAVEGLARQGRPVFLLATSCEPELCKERVMTRALDSGRFVPIALIDAKVGVPEAALEAAISTGFVRGWLIVDTCGAVPEVLRAGGESLGEVSTSDSP